MRGQYQKICPFSTTVHIHRTTPPPLCAMVCCGYSYEDWGRGGGCGSSEVAEVVEVEVVAKVVIVMVEMVSRGQMEVPAKRYG